MHYMKVDLHRPVMGTDIFFFFFLFCRTSKYSQTVWDLDPPDMFQNPWKYYDYTVRYYRWTELWSSKNQTQFNAIFETSQSWPVIIKVFGMVVIFSVLLKHVKGSRYQTVLRGVCHLSPFLRLIPFPIHHHYFQYHCLILQISWPLVVHAVIPKLQLAHIWYRHRRSHIWHKIHKHMRHVCGKIYQ